jgi:hypothetical protein
MRVLLRALLVLCRIDSVRLLGYLAGGVIEQMHQGSGLRALGAYSAQAGSGEFRKGNWCCGPY